MQIIFSFMQLSMHLMKDQVVNRDWALKLDRNVAIAVFKGIKVF